MPAIYKSEHFYLLIIHEETTNAEEIIEKIGFQNLSAVRELRIVDSQLSRNHHEIAKLFPHLEALEVVSIDNRDVNNEVLHAINQQLSQLPSLKIIKSEQKISIDESSKIHYLDPLMKLPQLRAYKKTNDEGKISFLSIAQAQSLIVAMKQKASLRSFIFSYDLPNVEAEKAIKTTLANFPELLEYFNYRVIENKKLALPNIVTPLLSYIDQFPFKTAPYLLDYDSEKNQFILNLKACNYSEVEQILLSLRKSSNFHATKFHIELPNTFASYFSLKYLDELLKVCPVSVTTADTPDIFISSQKPEKKDISFNSINFYFQGNEKKAKGEEKLTGNIAFSVRDPFGKITEEKLKIVNKKFRKLLLKSIQTGNKVSASKIPPEISAILAKIFEANRIDAFSRKLNPEPKPDASEMEINAYIAISMLNDYLACGNTELQLFLNDKQLLFFCLNALKDYITSTHEKTDLLMLIMEVFAVHYLCYSETIDGLEGFHKYSHDRENEEMRKLEGEIINLLHSTQDSLNFHFNHSEGKYAIEKAQAFWGKIAIYETKESISDGMFCYGRYLDHYYQTEKHPKPNDKNNGLYWVRLSMQLFANVKAYHYLEEKTFESASPADKFQLSLASESDSTLPHPAFYNLLPEENRLSVLASFVMGSLSAALREPKHTLTESYQLALMQEHLLSPERKIAILEKTEASRPGYYKTANFFTPTLYQEKQALYQHKDKPLAKELIQKILPILEIPDSVRSQTTLDSSILMENIPLKDRARAFCILFYDNLALYTQEGMLFDSKFDNNEDSMLMAVLVHELLSRGLAYFKLENTRIAQKLHKSMMSIKSQLQDLFFLLKAKNNSLNFQQTIQLRIHSYATAGAVANVTKLERLKAFGEQETKKEKSKGEKVLNSAAAFIESAHFILPLLIVGPHFALATMAKYAAASMVIKGFIKATELVYKYAHKAEHGMESIKLGTDAITKGLHAQHFAHEGGLISHGAHEADHNPFAAVQHLNFLLHSAGVSDADAYNLVMKEWLAIYEPVIENLSDKGAMMLGVLLIELLMRGLQTRLHCVNKYESQGYLPKSLPELLNYFNETLWAYSHFSAADQCLLVTKDQKSIPALEIIFPEQLTVKAGSKKMALSIASNRATDAKSFLKQNGSPTLVRYASSYEIKILNTKSSTAALQLTEESQEIVKACGNMELYPAYLQPKTHGSSIFLLIEQAKLTQLYLEANSLHDVAKDILKEKNGKDEVLHKLKALKMCLNQLNKQILLSKDTGALEEKLYQIIPTLKTDIPVETAIGSYLDKVAAELILRSRKEQIKSDLVDLLALSSAEDAALEKIISEQSITYEKPKKKASITSFFAKKAITLSPLVAPSSPPPLAAANEEQMRDGEAIDSSHKGLQ